MTAAHLPEPYWQDDLVTIYLGDSRDLLPMLDADVMVTDPPYGISHVKMGTNKGKVFTTAGASIANDRDTTARDHVLAAWGERPALVFGSPLIAPPAGARQVLVWHKDEGGAGIIGNVRGWRRDWEAVFVTGPWPISRASDSSVLAYGGNRFESAATGHAHTKPVGLMRDLIGKCPPGTIIDPFMGSGSTLRAAKDLGRKCIGIEVDEKWCEVAVARMGQGVLAL